MLPRRASLGNKSPPSLGSNEIEEKWQSSDPYQKAASSDRLATKIDGMDAAWEPLAAID